jgi:hypothetical protein
MEATGSLLLGLGEATGAYMDVERSRREEEGSFFRLVLLSVKDSENGTTLSAADRCTSYVQS